MESNLKVVLIRSITISGIFLAVSLLLFVLVNPILGTSVFIFSLAVVVMFGYVILTEKGKEINPTIVIYIILLLIGLAILVFLPLIVPGL